MLKEEMRMDRRWNKLRKDQDLQFGKKNRPKVQFAMSPTNQFMNSSQHNQDVFSTHRNQIMGVSPQNQKNQVDQRGRSIPINPRLQKKDIWGAIATQQSEFQKRQDEELKLFKLANQQSYKADLERQQDFYRKVSEKEQPSSQAQEDLITKNLNRAESEGAIRLQLRKHWNEENFQSSKQRNSSFTKEKQNDNKIYTDNLKIRSNIMEDRYRSQIHLKNSIEQSNKQFNSNQIEFRNQKMNELEKYEMKTNTKTGLQFNDLQEQKRQRFLQEFKHYQNQIDRASLEPNVDLQHIHAQERQNLTQKEEDYRRQDAEAMKKRRDAKDDMLTVLDNQLKLRESQFQDEVQSKKRYGDLMQKQMHLDAANVLAEEKLKRETQQHYNHDLANQVEKAQSIRRKQISLTEHEKRLNRMDLNNYLQGNRSAVAKLPGMSISPSNNRLPRQLDQFSFETPTKTTHNLLSPNAKRSQSVSRFSKSYYPLVEAYKAKLMS